MSEFTKEEISAIRGVKRAFRKLPKTVKLYCTDTELSACKAGTPSEEEYMDILAHGINAGCVLTDMHDDNNNGEDSSTIKVSP